jgi:hypothetical protein
LRAVTIAVFFPGASTIAAAALAGAAGADVGGSGFTSTVALAAASMARATGSGVR